MREWRAGGGCLTPRACRMGCVFVTPRAAILLESSNEAEHPEAWVTMSRRDSFIARALFCKRFSWHYADAVRQPPRHAAAA
jgi:hypothetical protein